MCDPGPSHGAPPAATLRWVAARVGAGARIDAWMRLAGGTACHAHAVDVVDARGGRHALVLKRFFRRDWLDRDPDAVAREARNLESLAGVALPIPRVVGVDAAGEACDVPALLTTRLPGRVDLVPVDAEAWLRRLAEPLAALHAIPEDLLTRFEPYRSYVDLDALTVPDWSARPGAWERAAARVQADPPAHRGGFVHRDYHPTNLLFHAGRLGAVLDFNDSSRGPTGADLGHCRLNLVQLYGCEMADRFAALYREAAPDAEPLDPYWDLLSAVQVLPGPDEVYPGWTRLGVRGLTTRLVRERLDDWVARRVSDLA